MSTRIDISPDQWDSETNSIKENCPGYDSLKAEIDDFSNIMQAYFLILSIEQETVTPIMLKNK